MTTTATADVVAAVFRPGPKIQQPVSGGEWTEYQKLRAEWKASKENIVTVVALSFAQKQRRGLGLVGQMQSARRVEFQAFTKCYPGHNIRQ